MRKRNHVVPVRLNAKELRFLDEQVQKSGLAREEFLRSLIVGAKFSLLFRIAVLHHTFF